MTSGYQAKDYPSTNSSSLQPRIWQILSIMGKRGKERPWFQYMTVWWSTISFSDSSRILQPLLWRDNSDILRRSIMGLNFLSISLNMFKTEYLLSHDIYWFTIQWPNSKNEQILGILKDVTK